jgi:hypothetical protein
MVMAVWRLIAAGWVFIVAGAVLATLGPWEGAVVCNATGLTILSAGFLHVQRRR